MQICIRDPSEIRVLFETSSVIYILHFQLSFQAIFLRAEEKHRRPCGFNPHGHCQVSSAVDRPSSMRTYFLNGALLCSKDAEGDSRALLLRIRICNNLVVSKHAYFSIKNSVIAYSATSLRPHVNPFALG